MFRMKDEYLIWRQLVAKLAVSSRDALYFNYFCVGPTVDVRSLRQDDFPKPIFFFNFYNNKKKYHLTEFDGNVQNVFLNMKKEMRFD